MRFKTDENLPDEIAGLLAGAGHDVLRVEDQGLSGAKDPTVAAVCRSEQRAIVTLDTDFQNIRQFPPESYSGIVVLRPRLQSIPRLMAMTSRFLLLLAHQPLVGRLWIVEETRIRIRPEEVEPTAS